MVNCTSARYLRAALLAAAFLLLLQGPPAGAEQKPPLPPALRESLATLRALEFNFEHGNWKEAEVATGRLERLFSSVMDTNAGAVTPRMLYDFGYSLGKLRVSLADRDRSKTQSHFMDVHDLFLKLSASFSFTVPPALEAIDGYVRETEGWLSQGNYDQVVFEMREVGRYFRNLYTVLEEQGVDSSKVWEYHKQINQVMAAAESGNPKRTAAALGKLKVLTTGFLDVFLAGDRPRDVNAVADP